MNNKDYGNRIERLYMNLFKQMNFKVKTSRFASRFMDNLGIDLTGLPFYVQIKAGRQKNLNYSKELNDIKLRVKDAGIQEKPLILIHHKKGVRGRKRKEYDSLVIMSFTDFKKIIK